MTNPLSGKSQDFTPLATDQTHSLHDPAGTPSDRKAAWEDIIQNAHGLGDGLWKTAAGVLVVATAGTDYLTAASSNTLTNKTLDSAGTGNAVKVNGTALTTVTGTGAVVLATSPTLVTPVLGAATATTINGTAVPSSGVLARTDVGNTFSGHQTIEGVTSTGATGTGKVVFDASPTITGHATIEGVTATGATGTGKAVYDTSPTLATPTLTSPVVTSPTVNLWDSWLSDTHTWTYASATSYANTFTIAADATAYLAKGTRIKLVNNAGTPNNTNPKYFVVLSAVFSAGTTTVTINGGDDYIIGNTTISNTQYSHGNPPDYPTSFNWTPTLSGWSVVPTNTVNRFSLAGKNCTIFVRQLTPGTSNNVTHTATLPITAATITNHTWITTGAFFDNGSTPVVGLASIASASTVVTLIGVVSTFNNTALGNSRVSAVQITYEI